MTDSTIRDSTIRAYEKTACVCRPLITAVESLLKNLKIGKVDLFGSYTQGLFLQSFSKVDINISTHATTDHFALHMIHRHLSRMNILASLVYTDRHTPMYLELPTRYVTFKIWSNNKLALLSSKSIQSYLEEHSTLHKALLHIKILTCAIKEQYGLWASIDSYTLTVIGIAYHRHVKPYHWTPEQLAFGLIRFLNSLCLPGTVVENPHSHSRCNLVKDMESFAWTCKELEKTNKISI